MEHRNIVHCYEIENSKLMLFRWKILNEININEGGFKCVNFIEFLVAVL